MDVQFKKKPPPPSPTNYKTTVPCMYEWTKSKQRQNQVTSHSNWAHILLFDLAHKQWNGIIKGSLRAISVNRKISCQYYGSVCSSLMSGYGVNPIFFNKKNEDWTSRTFATPTQLCPITSHFSLTTAALPSPPHTHTHPTLSLKVGVMCVSPLTRFTRGLRRTQPEI